MCGGNRLGRAWVTNEGERSAGQQAVPAPADAQAGACEARSRTGRHGRLTGFIFRGAGSLCDASATASFLGREDGNERKF